MSEDHPKIKVIKLNSTKLHVDGIIHPLLRVCVLKCGILQLNAMPACGMGGHRQEYGSDKDHNGRWCRWLLPSLLRATLSQLHGMCSHEMVTTEPGQIGYRPKDGDGQGRHLTVHWGRISITPHLHHTTIKGEVHGTSWLNVHRSWRGGRTNE